MRVVRPSWGQWAIIEAGMGTVAIAVSLAGFHLPTILHENHLRHDPAFTAVGLAITFWFVLALMLPIGASMARRRHAAAGLVAGKPKNIAAAWKNARFRRSRLGTWAKIAAVMAFLLPPLFDLLDPSLTHLSPSPAEVQAVLWRIGGRCLLLWPFWLGPWVGHSGKWLRVRVRRESVPGAGAGDAWVRPSVASLVVLELILLPLPFIAVMAYRAELNRRIEVQHARIMADHDPVTLQEMRIRYETTAPARNAADIYLRAFTLLKRDKPLEEHLPLFGDGEGPALDVPYPSQAKAALAAILARNREAIELLRQAAAVRACRFPLQFDKGLEGPVSHLGNYVYATRLLWARATLAAEDGDAAATSEGLFTLASMAHALDEEPGNGAQMCRIFAAARVRFMALRAIHRVDLSSADLRRLAGELEALEDHGSLTMQLVGRRCAANEFVMDRPDDDAAFMDGLGLKDLERSVALSLFTDLVEASHHSLPGRTAEFKSLSQRVDDLPHVYFRSSNLGMAISEHLLEDASAAALVRTAAVGVAVEHYRAIHAGQLPDRLDQLTAEDISSVPADPYDGRPLRYLKRGNGFIVYSVGPDLVDNGGKEPGPRQGLTASGTDICFTVLR